MLKDLIKKHSIIHIAGREYRVRYSLNALLCLEMLYKPLDDILKTPFPQWSVEDVVQLAHAAMCCLPKNFKSVNRRDFENIRPTVAELGELISIEDLPVLRVHRRTSSEGDQPGTKPGQIGQGPRFHPAKAGFAVFFENVRNTHPGGFLDPVIQIQK